MNRDWLIGPRGRMLALGVTLLFGVIVRAAIIDPALSWHAERTEVFNQRRALLARMERLAATLPALQRQAEDGTADRPAAGITLGGASDAVAGALLQERVQAMANAAGATLTSVETLPPEPAGAWRRIGLRVAMSAPWPVLVRLLQALDQATPHMLTDDLHVHSTLLIARPVALPLQTSFTVYAFRAAGPAETAKP